MTANRRNFLKTSLSGVALATVGSSSVLSACAQPKSQPAGSQSNLPLKLSFQEGTAPGETLAAKFDYMEKYNIVGFEPWGSNLADRINEFEQELKGRNIQISAICAGFKGFLLSTEETVRKECMDSLKEIIAAAGALKSVGVVMVPGFNGQQPAMPQTIETRNFLCEMLHELGEFAVQHQTSVILEPLNRTEAFFLRQVGDAASICRDTKSEGVKCMGDFWHMTMEENSDEGALLSAKGYLQHVHVASRKRRSMPGEDGSADTYIDGFRALKALNYQHYVSFECGCQGDREIVLPNAVKLLREQWDQA